MKTEFKYIRFDQVITTLWLCKNKKSGEVLAGIEWYREWNQICFYPNADTVFSPDCLRDIADFIDSLPPKGEEQ